MGMSVEYIQFKNVLSYSQNTDRKDGGVNCYSKANHMVFILLKNHIKWKKKRIGLKEAAQFQLN